MATSTFFGSDDNTEAFNINNRLVLKRLLRAERRLREPFPSTALETWRRAALQQCSVTPTTGRNDLATRGRVVILYAHDADLGSMFRSLETTVPPDVAGYYVDKRTAREADGALSASYPLTPQVMGELRKLNVPGQYLSLMLTRLESSAYTHRVAGVCAAVYLASLLLAEANK